MKISRLHQLLLSQSNISRLDQLKVSYALELLRNEAIKTVIYGIIFFIAGYFAEFMLCFFISCTLRIFSGGIHMKTNIGCFFMGILLLCGDILLLPKLTLVQTEYWILLWSSSLIICVLSPIPSYKRPFKTQKRYVMCKRYSILFCIGWSFILTFILAPSYLQHCGIWFFTMQALQLILQKIYRSFKSMKDWRCFPCSKK